MPAAAAILLPGVGARPWRVVRVGAEGEPRALKQPGAGSDGAEAKEGDLVEIAGAEGEMPRDLARRSAAAIGAIGARSVLVALHARQCLCGSIPLAGMPRRGRARAMLYQLEAQLPAAAEELWADFITDGDTALGVCAPAELLETIREALAEVGASVAAICPASLLFLQSLDRDCAAGLREVEAVVWQEEPGAMFAELFLLRDRRPRAWHALPGGARDARRALAALAARHAGTGTDEATPGAGSGAAMPVAIVGAGEALAQAVREMPGVRAVELPESAALTVMGRVVAEASRVLAGSSEAPLELRPPGAPAIARLRALRRPIAFAAGSAAALYVALAVGLLVRAERYARLANRSDEQKAGLYQTLFPGAPMPLGIESRLQAARRSLQRSAGASDEGGPSALLTLRQVLERLPRDVPCEIVEMQFDGLKLTLRGKVAAHEQADRIAAALRRADAAGSFAIGDPQTESGGDRPGDGIEFVLTGAWSPAPGPLAAARAPGARANIEPGEGR